MAEHSPRPDSNEREQFADASVPSLTALRAFEAIGSTGGLRRAARYLRVDHAVVSRHLRSLEVAVGVALVDRNQAGGRLTPAGQHYH
ncbi:MAG: LysR family transcriptional regulator, partial [Alphaproteobacteria bacterium]